MMYELLNKARREGLMALESDIEDPAKSPILSKYPGFLKDHHVRDYFCDTMRMAVSGVEAFDLDQLLDLDLEVHHHERQSARGLAQHHGRLLARPRHCRCGARGRNYHGHLWVVRRKKSAAKSPPLWSAHFLGILLCYGLVGPLAASMQKTAEDQKAPTCTCCAW